MNILKDAQIISNAEKVVTGQEVKKNVRDILKRLLKLKVINGFESDVNYSHKKFKYENQFKCDFVVKTIDDKYVLIRASNSYRSDRAKIAFYDLHGIQNYSKFSGNIVASILLFPDNEENQSSFISTREKVTSGIFYSPASHWLTFTELKEFFDNYRYEVINAEKSEELEFEDYLKNNLKTRERNGSYFGKSGNILEKYLVEIINDNNNLLNYKKGCNEYSEYNSILDEIISTYGINKNKIIRIKATDSITKLKNGGSAKTDVFVEIYTDEINYSASISVKNSKEAFVSCHDYQASDFVRVIAPNDSDFKLFIETFQKMGSWKNYSNELASKDININTDELINRYKKRIIEWAVFGMHDAENIIRSEMQIVNFIFIRNSETKQCNVYNSSNYISELMNHPSKKMGAPFRWTYPSKQRGKRVQLKMPLNIK